MRLDNLLPRLEKVRRCGDQWQARCPAHDDKEPSLTLREANDGKILLYCHAGCTPEAVCSALGITLKDLMPEQRNGHADKPRIIAEYDYTDEHGALLYRVCRLEPKSFRQRRPDGKGGWNWSTKDVRRIPYRLAELLKAISENRPIFVCEGEKDTDRLIKEGFAATCNDGGAGKWRECHSQFFKGATVIIIADKDDPGRKHAQSVADSLKDHAASVKVIELPDVNDKPVKDASDFFNVGGTAAEFDEIAQSYGLAWLELVGDGAKIVAENLPPIVEIMDGIVAEQSKLVIGSGSKSFKTWLSMDMGLSIAHGKPCLGRQVTRQRVLYVNLELKEQTFKRRLQTVAKAKGITVEEGWFLHLPLRGKMAGLSVSEFVSRIIRLAQHFGATVVIIDPIYKANTEGEENNSRDQTIFFNQLDRITTEAGCTLILNDHFGKGNQSEKDPLDAIRGSSAKGGDVDAAMVLRKHENKDCFRVDVIHRELPPVEPFCLGWKFPLMELRPDLDPDAMKKPKAGRPATYDLRELLAVLAESENPASVSDWAKRAGIKRQTLSTRYLPKLRAKGWIKTIGEGNGARQSLTDTGREVAQKYLEESA